MINVNGFFCPSHEDHLSSTQVPYPFLGACRDHIYFEPFDSRSHVPRPPDSPNELCRGSFTSPPGHFWTILPQPLLVIPSHSYSRDGPVFEVNGRLPQIRRPAPSVHRQTMRYGLVTPGQKKLLSGFLPLHFQAPPYERSFFCPPCRPFRRRKSVVVSTPSFCRRKSQFTVGTHPHCMLTPPSAPRTRLFLASGLLISRCP